MKDMQADESVTGRFGRLNKNKIKKTIINTTKIPKNDKWNKNDCREVQSYTEMQTFILLTRDTADYWSIMITDAEHSLVAVIKITPLFQMMAFLFSLEPSNRLQTASGCKQESVCRQRMMEVRGRKMKAVLRLEGRMRTESMSEKCCKTSYLQNHKLLNKNKLFSLLF